MAIIRDLYNRLDGESAGPMPRSDPSFAEMLSYPKMEEFRQFQYELEERFRQLQYEALRKEVEKRYRGNPTWMALAAKSARMFRALEKPHNSQEEKPWTTVSSRHGFVETSQPCWVNNIDQVLGFGPFGHPNLAGSSSGFHFQQQEMSGGEELRIEIPDEYDDHIPCGNPWMPNLGYGETNFAVASPSGIKNFAGDDSESSTGSFLNQQEASIEAAATVSEMHNHSNNNDSAHETKFRPEVNTMLAAIAGQASVNLISSSSTHDSMYVRLFAAASGVGFLGSFFAIHLLKRPKLAKVLSKIGAIGTASSIIIGLGINVLQDTNWYLKDVVGLGAIAAGCLISGVAVVVAD